MTNSIGEIVGNDVLFIIGSNATEAHPIIGNKMKQAHLRGAKLIVVDPRRTELAEHAHLWLRLRPGTDNALVNGCCTPSSERLARQGVHRRAHRGLRRPLGDRQGLPGGARRGDHRRAGGDDRRGGGALRDDAEGRHLLHARHHRAHRGHRQRHEPGQPRHGHRSHRRPERRREPHARPEQRAGLVRHGRAAQLVPGLPERARLRGAEEVRRRSTACRCRRTWACASPRCSTSRCTARSRRCSSWARTRRSPTPTPTTCARRSGTSTSSSSRTSS